MKRILHLFFALIVLVNLSAQKSREIPLKEYFADAEYFYIQEYYLDALSDYLEVYKRGYDNNANINYHIGICYLNIPGQKNRSIHYLEKAALNASDKYSESTLNEVYAPLDVFLYLGNAYRIEYQLDTAISRYNTYLGLLDPKNTSEKAFVTKQIYACNLAKDYIKDPVRVNFENLGQLINTNKANYNAVVSGDGNTLVYMSKLPFYDAVFYSRKRGNNWSRPINITPQLMSDGDQIVTGLSYDGTKLLLSKADAFNSDILISNFDDGKWKGSKPFKELNTKFWESHASYANNDSTIYFTSNRKGGVGEMDIYKIELASGGEWGTPQNIGEPINTELSEEAPFVTEDGSRIYFSSQGHNTIGGYDLFYASLKDTGWADVENLRYPISTTDEDIFFFPLDNLGERAYVHRIEEDGYGVFDIYEMSYLSEEEIEEAVTAQVTDDVDEEEEIAIVKPVEPVEIKLQPIFFEFDKTSYPKEVNAQLDAVIKLLADNPSVKLKIIGHTDAVGSSAYNLELSKKRAREVSRYLIQAGVEAEKLETIGMGEKSFIAKNKKADGSDNPEGRRFNRRVELEIVGYNSEQYIIKRVELVPEDLKIESK